MGNVIAGILIGICITYLAGPWAMRRTIKELKQKGWLK